MFTPPQLKSQFSLNTGTLNLRCRLYPSPAGVFSYTNFGIGTVIDSACPGNIDKIIIDGKAQKAEEKAEKKTPKK